MRRFFAASITLTATLGYLLTGTAVKADTLASFCAYYSPGEQQPEVAMPCDFAQSHGTVGIVWNDGVYNQFDPVTNQTNVFTDERGRRVYKQGTQGPADVVFQLETGPVIEVYWISL